MVNLLSIKTLGQIGLNRDSIQNCGRYNIRSSTDTVENCIIGTIEVNMHILLTDRNVKFSNFAKEKCKFLVASENVNLDRILLGIPFLKDHNIKMHFHKNHCKILGTFRTEQGFEKVRLHNNFAETDTILGVNLTTLQKGYNLANFEVNKVICSDFKAKISQTQHLGLDFPEYVHIQPTYDIKYRQNGWPFMIHSKVIKMSIKTEAVLTANTVNLNFTKICTGDQETMLESNQAQINHSQDTGYDICHYSRHINEVMCLFSQLAVSGQKISTFQKDELLGHTADYVNKYTESQPSPGQAV